MLANPSEILGEFQTLDIDKLPKTALSNCRLITRSLSLDAVKATSCAAVALADWAIKVVKYHEGIGSFQGSLDEVKPKMIVEGAKVSSTGTSSGNQSKKSLPNCYINKHDIVELKSLANPPAGVKAVIQCVQILLGKDEEWAAAKRMLGSSTFLNVLMEYRREDATEDKLQRVQLLLENDEVLRDDNLLKVSKAAYGLLRWVRTVASSAVAKARMCPEEMELDGELRTATPTPLSTPASTQGGMSCASTPNADSTNKEKDSGTLLLHNSEALAVTKAEQLAKAHSIHSQNPEEKDKKCVIS